MFFKKYCLIIFLLAVSYIPVLDLFNKGYPDTHDIGEHLVRLTSFYHSLQEGIIVPRWAGNLNWGYGNPVLMFFYPLPSYFASFFHFIGFSFVDSIKIVYGLPFFFSGFFMYVWLKNFMEKIPALAGAILYMYAPYRFVDLYVRGAIGENMAFLFLPLVLYFLFKLSKIRILSNSKTLLFLFCLSLSFSFLILSHNSMSLMFLPIIVVYAFYLTWQSNFSKRLTLLYLIGFLFGFGLSAFFWMPAFFEGKYTLRNIITKGEYSSRFVGLDNLLYGPWNYGISGQFTVQIGIANIFSILLFPVFLISSFLKKNKFLIFIVALILYSFVAIFLMLKESNIVWERIMLLQNFQFPWRFLSVLVFTTSLFFALLLKTLNKRYQLIIFFIFITFTLIISRNYWHAKRYFNKEVRYSSVYDGTSDTGESEPIWSVRFMEKRAKAGVEVIEGKAEIKKKSRTSTVHEYKIKTKERARIRENTLYFPGWKVYANGVSVPIEFQDPQNRGLITFFLDKGEYDLKVKFEDTKLRTFSNSISVLSIIAFVILLFLSQALKWKKIK